MFSQDLDHIIRLWYHECSRVYMDRLINDIDRGWFDGILKDKIKKQFHTDPDTSLGKEIILFGDFLDPTTDVRLYEQITDMDKVICITICLNLLKFDRLFF